MTVEGFNSVIKNEALLIHGINQLFA